MSRVWLCIRVHARLCVCVCAFVWISHKWQAFVYAVRRAHVYVSVCTSAFLVSHTCMLVYRSSFGSRRTAAKRRHTSEASSALVVHVCVGRMRVVGATVGGKQWHCARKGSREPQMGFFFFKFRIKWHFLLINIIYIYIHVCIIWKFLYEINSKWLSPLNIFSLPSMLAIGTYK